MKSIIQKGRYCLISGSTKDLHKHHIFNGPLRNWSEENGLWCYLDWNIHRQLHDGSGKEEELKRIGQYMYEKNHSRDEFMAHVRKNYLVTPLSEQEKLDYKIDCAEFDISDDFLPFNNQFISFIRCQ